MIKAVVKATLRAGKLLFEEKRTGLDARR